MDSYIKQKALENLINNYQDVLPVSITLLTEFDDKLDDLPLNLSAVNKKINSSLKQASYDLLEEQTVSALNKILTEVLTDEEEIEVMIDAASRKVLLELAYMTGVKDTLANTDLMRGLLIAVNDDLPIYFNFKKEMNTNRKGNI